jgi:nicotinamidase-related amidase
MLLNPTESQLVLIDYQTRLLPAIHEGNSVVAQALKLAQIAKLLRVPTLGTEHNPSSLGHNDPALKALCSRRGRLRKRKIKHAKPVAVVSTA